MTLIVEPRGQRTPRPRQTRPARRALTALARTEKRETFARPAGEPGGETRLEVWTAYSADALWEYHRVDDGALTPWLVRYVPTGQTFEGPGRLSDAREITASGVLLNMFRADAYALAFGEEGGERRRDGQRWLAIHMRGAGKTTGRDADHRCECGGLLIPATSDGRLAHVDACAECYVYGRGLVGDTCELADGHRFCADPRPVDCGHQVDNRCSSPATPNRGAGCGRQGDVDCCGGCCWGE